MSGPATFRAGEQPRDGTVEFSDERHTVSLPMRGALPVLTRAHSQPDVHPSVALLSGAALLGMRLVAAGRFAPDETGTRWQVAGLDAADEDRIVQLARARADEGLDVGTAEGIVRAVLEAVADAMPRAAPLATRRSPEPGPRPRTGSTPTSPAASRSGSPGPGSGATTTAPSWSTSRCGSRPTRRSWSRAPCASCSRSWPPTTPRVADAALLWTEADEPGSSYGFGDRARTHASIALRAAAGRGRCSAGCWSCECPTRSPSTATYWAFRRGGPGPRRDRRLVLWPRYLGRDVTSRVVLSRPPASRAEPLWTGLFGPTRCSASPGSSRCTARLGDEEMDDLARTRRRSHQDPGQLDDRRAPAVLKQVALHGEALTEEEMAARRGRRPVLQLRGGWTVVDPDPRKARSG